MKLIHFPDAPDQKLGVQNDHLDKVFKTEADKKNTFHFYAQILAKCFDRFFEFFNFDNFRRRFTTLKQSLQKKVTFHDVRLEKMRILYFTLF